MFRWLAFSTTLLGLSLSAIPVPCSAAQLGDVEHIIVIYLENHSFDNLFGFFPNATALPPPERPRFSSIRMGTPIRFCRAC